MKDAYLRVLEAWLDQWNARLNESQARIDAVTGAMAALDDAERDDYGRHLLVLQERIEHARAALDEGRSRVDALRANEAAWHDAGSESAWELFKTGAEAAWDDLKLALDQAVAEPPKPPDRNGPAIDQDQAPIDEPEHKVNPGKPT